MFKYFSFKKKANSANSSIDRKLDRIIELLEEMQKEKPAKNFTIDHVQIDHLENLTFRLGNIDIDELSGKLVIGNNIMATEEWTDQLVQKIDKEKAKEEAVAKKAPSQFEQVISTPRGFRYRKNP